MVNVAMAMILLAALLFVGGFWPRKKSVEPPAPKREQCASTCFVGSIYRCEGLADPRCKAGNCTAHCNQHCGVDCRLPVGKPGSLRSVK
jgi:hypothetical protein